MFKAIFLFIKAHTIATIVTTTVVVGTVVATPIVVENYNLDKQVRENLDMLVSSDYKVPSDNNETKNNVVSNNNEQPSENKSVNTNEPLTFRIEKVYSQLDNISVDYTKGNQAINNAKERGIEYKIVPSYDKDFSKWTKEEKEAYQKLLEDIRTMAEQDYNAVAQNEKQIMDNLQKEADLIEASWSEYYTCLSGTIAYNSYTKQYKGHYTKDIIATPDEYNSGYTYQYDKVHFSDVSAEEFRTVIYPIMVQTYKKGKELEVFDLSDIKNYSKNLEIVYHLSD